jgi:hypothetical protein
VIPRLLRIAPATLALFLGGCAHNHVMEVEALRKTGTPTDLDNVSYYVVGVHDTSASPGGPLHRKEAATLLAAALAVRGMFIAPTPDRADVLIELTYGLDPHQILVHELNNPVLGFNKTKVAEEVRMKNLNVTARTQPKAGDTQPPAVLWTVHVRVRDARNELRTYLPIMAEVAADWASRNTHGTRTFTATLEDGSLIYVSGGYEQPGISPFAEK